MTSLNENTQKNQNDHINTVIDKGVLFKNYKIFQINTNINNQQTQSQSDDSFFMRLLKQLCLFSFNSNPEYKFAKDKLNKKLDIIMF